MPAFCAGNNHPGSPSADIELCVPTNATCVERPRAQRRAAVALADPHRLRLRGAERERKRARGDDERARPTARRRGDPSAGARGADDPTAPDDDATDARRPTTRGARRPRRPARRRRRGARERDPTRRPRRRAPDDPAAPGDDAAAPADWPRGRDGVVAGGATRRSNSAVPHRTASAPATITATRSTTSGAASATAPNAIAATARPVGGTRSPTSRTRARNAPGAGGCHTAAAAVVTSNAPAHTTQHRTASGSSHVSSTARTAASPVTTCGTTVATSAVSPAQAATAAPTRIAAARRATAGPAERLARSRAPPDDPPPAPAPARDRRPRPRTAAAPASRATASAIQASHFASSAACTSASGGPSAVSVKVHADGVRDARGEVGSEPVQRLGDQQSGVDDGQRHGAGVGVEGGAVQVADRAADDRAERGAAHDALSRAQHQRPYGDQVGCAVITASVRRRATSRAHRLRLQGLLGPGGEAVGVEHLARRERRDHAAP